VIGLVELKVEQSQGDQYLFEKRMELKINMIMQKLQKDVDTLKTQLSEANAEISSLRSKTESMEQRQQQVPQQMVPQMMMQQQPFQQVPPQMFTQQGQQMQYVQQPQQIPVQQAVPVQQGVPMSSSGSVGAAVAQNQQNVQVDLGKMFYMGGKR
jgi:hypothetical protein